MDERVIKRGEVYEVLFGEGYGSEVKSHRPAVIVSSEKGNETSGLVLVAFITSKRKYGVINVPLNDTGVYGWVQCNQIQSISKERLTTYKCVLSEEKMSEIDKGLKVALGLSLIEDDSDWEDERRELEEEIVSLKNQLSRRDDSSVGITVERDMWKKMYEKALDMLVAKSINTASEAVVVEEPKPKTEPRVEFVTEPEVTADINTASEAELRQCGCTPDMSRQIIENRPYKSVGDLKKFNWMTRIGFQIVKNRLTCEVVVEKPKVTEKQTEKININTASAKEIYKALGCCESYGYTITGYRGKNGNYVALEELRDVKGLPKSFIDRFGERLTI